MKRNWIVALLIGMLILSGCASGKTASDTAAANGSASDGTLKWNLATEPKTIDPQLNSEDDGGNIINNTFEGLYRHQSGELKPAIAEAYEVSEDGLTYTFKLKPTLWSDGTPLTANDFVYAWKRALDPALATEFAYQLFCIEGAQGYAEGDGSAEDVKIEAIDDLTLKVGLVAPTPYFLDLLTFFTYMPTKQSVVEANPEGRWAMDPVVAVCNGPFKLAEYRTGDGMTLVKNENYWDAENVKLTEIDIYFIVSEEEMLEAYRGNKLDIIDSMPPAEIPNLQANDPTFRINPVLATYYYEFNTTVAPVDDPQVRRALSLAIDRRTIVDSITKSGEMPATGFLPYGLTDANGADCREASGAYGIDTEAASIEEAKYLLDLAGYPNGEGFPEIEILYSTSESYKAIAEAVAEMWKKNLSINARAVNQDSVAFQETRSMGDFVIAGNRWLADYADPMTFMEMWTSYSPHNDARWRSEEYDSRIEESRLMEEQQRYNTIYQAEKILMDDSILIPIYYLNDPLMVKDRVQGWEKTALGFWYFGNVSLTQ